MNSAVAIGPIPGFAVTEARYGPRSSQAWHDHAEARLVVTVSGGFTETWTRLRHACGPAGALLRPAGERHTDCYHASGAVCVTVRFGQDWAGRFEECGIPSGSNGSAEMGPLAGRLYRELHSEDPAAPVGIQCAVLDILSRFGRQKECIRERRPPHWIESTKDLLRSRLNSPPDVLETARLAGVHAAHLSRTFRQFTGMTLGAYLRCQRVEFARGRLRSSRDSLADIAQQAGFCDQAHFSRVFRQQVGVGPKEYRRSVIDR